MPIPNLTTISEEWRDIPGYKGLYQVSDQGRIKSFWHKNSIIMKPSQKHGAYLWINLYNHKRKIWHASVHRIVALAFLGQPPDKAEVNHKNGIKWDNRLDNLEYVTTKENRQHAKNVLGVKYGGHHNGKLYGEGNGRSKLTKNDVVKLRQLATNGYRNTKLADMFGISTRMVWAIKTRRNWKCVD